MATRRITESSRVDGRLGELLLVVQDVLHSRPDSLARRLSLTPLTLYDVEWMKDQGLAPYIYFRLQEWQLLPHLSGDVVSLLRNSYYEGALLEALQHQEAVTLVLTALAKAEVEVVVLKGMALANSVYPTPRCRLKGDLDLWIRAEQYDAAMEALQQIGYYPKYASNRSLMLLYQGEQQLVSDTPGRGLIELHCPAIWGEWIRKAARINHDDIWDRKVAAKIGEQPVYFMATEDLLIHLCLHQAINHQFGSPWMRSLLDIHLLIQALSPDWQMVVARARAWHVATAVWTVLSLAQQLCATLVPEKTLTALAPSTMRRWSIGRLRLEQATLERYPTGYNHRRLLIQLLLIDDGKDFMRLIWGSLFPEAGWLQARYNIQSGPALWRARLLYPWHLLTHARS